MMAEVGDIRKVTGRSIDIAPVGPRPGSTPTKVPNKTPKKQNEILSGWNMI